MKNLSKVTTTKFSSTITTGGTAQTAIAENASRHFLLIQNPPNEVENLYVDFGTAAVSTESSIELEPGAMLILDTLMPTTYVSVLAATTGHNFIAYEG